LADFDPQTARAVVVVLRRAGVPAALVGDGEAAEEVTVAVPGDHRDAAIRALASGMDDVHAEVARQRGSAPPTTAPSGAEDDDEEGPPLLFERLRHLGFLPVLLVPLLVITLAQVRLPAAYTIAIIVGGTAALVAWRDGRRRRDG
jgi:hypothetical protein